MDHVPREKNILSPVLLPAPTRFIHFPSLLGESVVIDSKKLTDSMTAKILRASAISDPDPVQIFPGRFVVLDAILKEKDLKKTPQTMWDESTSNILVGWVPPYSTQLGCQGDEISTAQHPSRCVVPEMLPPECSVDAAAGSYPEDGGLQPFSAKHPKVASKSKSCTGISLPILTSSFRVHLAAEEALEGARRRGTPELDTLVPLPYPGT